jgi:CBS domain-containing protein
MKQQRDVRCSRASWTLADYLLRRSPWPAPPVVLADDDFIHVAKLLGTDVLPRSVYVVAEDGRYLGSIGYRQFAKRLLEYLNPALYLADHPSAGIELLRVFEYPGTAKAGSLVRPGAPTLRTSDTLARAMDALHAEEADELPVVDDDGRLVGVVRTSDVIREWVDDELARGGDDTGSWY